MEPNWNPTRDAKAALLRAMPEHTRGAARVFIAPFRPTGPTPANPDAPSAASVPAMLVLYSPRGLDARSGDALTASHTRPSPDGAIRKVGAWRFNLDGLALDSVAPFGDAFAVGAWLVAMPDATRPDVAAIVGGERAWWCAGSLDSWALTLGLCVEAEASRAA
jgi:hypothetical protein